MAIYMTKLRLTYPEDKTLPTLDLYALHRIVYDLFDDWRDQQQKKSNIPSGIQWVEGRKTALSNELLILSNRPVKQEKRNQHANIITSVIPENFFSHRRYLFEVIVNPCRREHETRKLVPIRDLEQVIQWFQKRTEISCGFSTTLQPIHAKKLHLSKCNSKQNITLHRVRLVGYLTVFDPAKFKQTVATGIGRGRAFGCGLLQVMPTI